MNILNEETLRLTRVETDSPVNVRINLVRLSLKLQLLRRERINIFFSILIDLLRRLDFHFGGFNNARQ